MSRARHSTDVYLRRRIVIGVLGVLALWLAFMVVSSVVRAVTGDGDSDMTDVAADAAREKKGDGDADKPDAPDDEPEETTTTSTTLVPADQRELVPVETINGTISPKSVVASGHGMFVAQNMMYQHTITVYDRAFNLVKTISDEIQPADWGFDFPAGTTLQGAPVEASFSPDGSKAYISNYHMYGGGYGPEPSDGCVATNRDPSFVYRIDMKSLEIDQVIQVGTVPKFLAVSPDGKKMLVSNWCSYDMSVVDIETGEETARLDVGRYPRGIAFHPSGERAYVAIMGGDQIAEIDMTTETVAGHWGMAGSPRHLVMGPEGKYLYVTLNRAGEVAKIDIASREVVARLATGQAPRSMTISDDGQVLFVVNYNSNTISRVLTESFEETQELPVGHHPIGITYDGATEQVWVANYGGSLMIFEDVPIGQGPREPAENSEAQVPDEAPEPES